MLVLGIETTCDETSIAVVKDGKTVLSNITISQVNKHKPHGGVVPELAAREHTKNLGYVLQDAINQANTKLEKIDYFAVSHKPGLPPAVSTGVSFATGLSLGRNKPLIKIDHLQAHSYALFLKQELSSPKYPILILLVSGGHTHLALFKSPKKFNILGQTVDDAVGESFDKVARMLNLGYPGGPIINKISNEGDESAIDFPRPMIDSKDYNFSFSGLKTAVLYYVSKHQKTLDDKSSELSQQLADYMVRDIAASFQEAVVETLTIKTLKLAKELNIKNIGLVGGVAANTRLRDVLGRNAHTLGISLYYPEIKYCTDNAATVAGLAYHLAK